jgi:hypothetical protein
MEDQMKTSGIKLGSLILFAAMLLLCVAVVVKVAKPQDAKAQGSKGAPVKCVDAPVTSVLQLTGDLTQSTNYRIEGDGLGPYYNGVDSVTSIIQAANCTGGVTGDWELNAIDSTTRPFLIDLRQPVPNSGAQQIFTYQYVPARVIVKCGYYAISGGFPAMSLNQTLSCPAFVHFTYAGTDYRLSMTSNGQPSYPETNDVQVSCRAVNSSTNKCAAWTVFPITQAGGAVQSIARLEKFGKSGSLTNFGDFYTTFLFNVTNP